MGEILNISVDIGERNIDFEIRYKGKKYVASKSNRLISYILQKEKIKVEEFIRDFINVKLTQLIEDEKNNK